jgi:hypothetical protein
MSLEKFLPSFFGASVGASAAAAMSGWLINKTLKEQEARLVSYKQYFDRIDRQFERQAVLLVEEMKKSTSRTTTETAVKELETVQAPPMATEISPIIETVEGPQLFSQAQIEESYAIGFAHGCVGGSVTSGLLGLLIEIVF